MSNRNIRSQLTLRATTVVAAALVLDNQVLVATANEPAVQPSTGAAGEKVVGFANMGAKVGESLGAINLGTAAPVASGDIAWGDDVVAAAGGKVKKATGGAGEVKVGRAETAAVDGEQVTIQVDIG